MAQVEREESDLPLSVQAEVLSISRSSLSYQPRPPSSEEIRIKHRIDELYTDSPFYGSRRMTAQLQREGMEINRKAVQRHMREMGIEAIFPGPNLSRRRLKDQVYPYLLRDLSIDHPNHVWGIDIRSIRMQRGWMYLVALLDWYSPYVLSWEVDMTLQMPFVLSTVKRALAQAVPIICNSDQGSHFTSPHYGELLPGANVQISMDGKGRALDNIFTERLCRSVKYEEVYLHEYTSRDPRHAHNCSAMANFTITSGFIKHWSTKPQLKCIFRNGRKTCIEAMSFENEQEESSSYNCLSQCLDRWVHFKGAVSAGRDPSNVHRLLNISGQFPRSGRSLLNGPPQQWAEELAGITLTYGVTGFILGTDDAPSIELFADEVAPATRELVAAERARR